MKIVPVQPIGVEIFWDKIKPLIKKEYNPYIEKIPQRIIKKYEHIKF